MFWHPSHRMVIPPPRGVTLSLRSMMPLLKNQASNRRTRPALPRRRPSPSNCRTRPAVPRQRPSPSNCRTGPAVPRRRPSPSNCRTRPAVPRRRPTIPPVHFAIFQIHHHQVGRRRLIISIIQEHSCLICKSRRQRRQENQKQSRKGRRVGRTRDKLQIYSKKREERDAEHRDSTPHAKAQQHRTDADKYEAELLASLPPNPPRPPATESSVAPPPPPMLTTFVAPELTQGVWWAARKKPGETGGQQKTEGKK